MSKPHQYINKVHEVKVLRTDAAKENIKISKSSLSLQDIVELSIWCAALDSCRISVWWNHYSSSSSVSNFLNWSLSYFSVKKSMGKKKATAKMFTNWPIFKLLKVVPYMPEVEHVLNICRIRDSGNAWIAVKLF